VSAALAFIAIETTGYLPDWHEPWEVAVVTWPDANEHVWALPLDHLGRADDRGLAKTGFHRRHPQGNEFAALGNGDIFARDLGHCASDIGRLTHGRHLVGIAPALSAQCLAQLLRSHNVVPSWAGSVHLDALIAGYLGTPPPWDALALSRAIGVEPSDFDRHSALGQCRWALSAYRAWLGLSEQARLAGPHAGRGEPDDFLSPV